MKKTSLFILAITLGFAVSCKKEVKENTETSSPDQKEAPAPAKAEKETKLKVALNPKSESKVNGNVVFTEENGTVHMVALLEGLDAGTHAIHLHEKADCSSADGKSTGGHWNPTAQPHGKWGNESGYHKGDIGNFVADEQGNGVVTFDTNEWCIGCGDETKDILGKAIIVHQGTDDFTSQPSGAAGSRVSCGGIIK